MRAPCCGNHWFLSCDTSVSELLDVSALLAILLSSAVPFGVQIKWVESRDGEQGSKEREERLMRGDSRWSICPSCARPCLPYPDQNPANSSKPGYESSGVLTKFPLLLFPQKSSCNKVNPEHRWGCACSGRALTSIRCRQSQCCLLCSPPSIFPVGDTMCWLWVPQTASL